MAKLTPELTSLVRRELCLLRIPPNLRGHHYLTYIVERVAVSPIRVKDITKDLYPEAAHCFDTDWRAVERNSRTAITACWRDPDGRERFCELAGRQLAARPRTAVFAAIVAAHTMDLYQRRA